MDTIADQLQSLPTTESNDIFSLSDQVLSDRLEFIEEIGFGNWGSVWLCRPKPTTTKDGVVKPLGQKLAVKLVHRSKTATTAARVRSLWNEMKVVRSFKTDPHPSIIPFHSFIITPSYALITMSYLPTLVPVEVAESKARQWFRFLLSGVEFLHKRGVVHNDIKPANILLSTKNIPVLVDFGFAEKYEMDSDTAFHSNLSYGTPEYLSPERARGLPHDTRKSDIWSLGVTFFEILVGRTPFENSDGEQFNSSDDLEKYWARTLRGKWVGTWEFSKGMEKLLQRMVAPNVDLRCTAMQAIADSYWQSGKMESLASHKRASSYNPTCFENDVANLLNMTPSSPASVSWKVKPTVQSPPGLNRSGIFKDGDDAVKRPTLAKSRSQPRVAIGTSKIAQPRKRAPAPPVIDLSPIKASPTASPNVSTTSAKENIQSFNRLANVANHDNKKWRNQNQNTESPKVGANKAATTSTPNILNNVRRPFGALTGRDNIPNSPAARTSAGKLVPSTPSRKPSGNTHGMKAVKVLGELKRDQGTPKPKAHAVSASIDENMHLSSNLSMNLNLGSGHHEKSKASSTVRDRVKEWERERERLREMERLEEMERQRDEIYKREKKERREKEREARKKEEQEKEKEILNAKSAGSRRNSIVQEEIEEEKKNASIMQIKIPPPSVTTTPSSTVKTSTSINTAATTVNNFIKSSSNNYNKISRDWDWDKENVGSSVISPVVTPFRPMSPLTQVFNIPSMETPHSTFPRAAGKEAKPNIFKHGFKASIDKTMQFYKSSTRAPAPSGRSTPARGFSFDVSRPSAAHYDPQPSVRDGKEAWDAVEGDGSIAEISTLPVITNAAETEQLAADSKMDRMTIWMRNVDKVVEEAKQNFASSSSKDIPLPALPLPLSRNHSQNHTSRLPRRVLAASQIFPPDESGSISMLSSMSDRSMMSAAYLSTNDTSRTSTTSGPASAPLPVTPAKRNLALPIDESSQFIIPEIYTPSRQRRATVSTGSPGPAEAHSVDFEGSSPSKRKEKSRSHGNLFQRHIAPISMLEAELLKTPPPQPTPRLSQVLDRNLFIAPLLTSRDDLLGGSMEPTREMTLDELTSSPCHVEPYPQRMCASFDTPDTPNRHRIEGVYDRFLMATSGVKRLGKGYQSENIGPMGNSQLGLGPTSAVPSKGRLFSSTRRVMPPPVSSDDQRRAASVDELSGFAYTDSASTGPLKDEGSTTAGGLMRKAMKLIAPKTTTSRRLSRIG